MYRTYQMRPETIRAIRITEANRDEVVDWISENVADEDRGIDIYDGTEGRGNARVEFRPRDAVHPRRVSVPVPGYLTADVYDTGMHYRGSSVEAFEAEWQPAD